MSRKAFTKLQAAFAIAIIICIVVIGVSVWWITKPKPSPLFHLKENAAKINIKVEAEGAVLHYREELFWSDAQFSEILRNENEFESNLTEQFNESLSMYGEHEEHAVNVNVTFNEAEKSTTLTCDIEGAMINSDYFTFRWLLDPLGLDFIVNKFQESEKELFWEGTIKGVPTSIIISFPFPINHCHAHVWRK